MNKSHNNNSEELLENNPAENASELPTSQEQTKTWYSQPAGLVSLFLIVAALILLALWLSKDTGKANPVSTTDASMLGQPVVLLKTKDLTPTPTLAPTSTLAPTPTVEPRTEVITYTIQQGDTIFSIADKFDLAPNTILWGNWHELGNDLSLYFPGQTIYILPVDGVYHVWQEGEGLNGVSEFYGVTPDDIIDFPANHLDRATLGNLSSPNITPGTRLVVPGGTRPETLSPDSLLTYAASRLIRELPLGTPESFPAPRKQIIAYEVQPQDTLFSIADKFGLEPETILWANRYLIGDTPDGIYPGQKLFILPTDGVLHGWSAEENLDVVAEFYDVSRDVILKEPLNNLDVTQFADLSHPDIKPGTMLFVPGGTRPPAIWVTYVSADEDGVGTHPNVSYLGSFACNSTATAYGTGAWQFPTTEHWLSGYDFTPPTHYGVDYAGRLGNELYATDTGVIIYAGWSNRGYGNTIVIDHGNGFLSLYAHIMDGGIAVSCGQVVSLGDLIGYMGSTGNSSGPHLHFEIRYKSSPVNPHDFGL
jgi:LysM repeat protein